MEDQIHKVEVSAATRGSEVTGILLAHAAEVARQCKANAILVYADVLPARQLAEAADLADKAIFVTKTQAAKTGEEQLGHRVICVPDVPMTRLGQLKVAVLLALNRGLLRRGDRVVCLSGIDRSRSLDTLMVMDVEHEFEMLLAPSENAAIAPGVEPQVLDRVIEIASDLGAEGREGKPVGALLTVGDTDHVLALAHQIVLNPFHGYPESERNILDVRLEETVKEFSTIDGAFVIRGDGTILTAGAYLKTSGVPASALPQGLGARHQAAAAITGVTDCVAVTVSQSTGTVTVFRKGRIVTEIEKPRSLAAQTLRSKTPAELC